MFWVLFSFSLWNDIYAHRLSFHGKYVCSRFLYVVRADFQRRVRPSHLRGKYYTFFFSFFFLIIGNKFLVINIFVACMLQKWYVTCRIINIILIIKNIYMLRAIYIKFVVNAWWVRGGMCIYFTNLLRLSKLECTLDSLNIYFVINIEEFLLHL